MITKHWSCFHCGFTGTEREVEDHKCGGNRIVVDKEGRKYKIVTYKYMVEGKNYEISKIY